MKKMNIEVSVEKLAKTVDMLAKTVEQGFNDIGEMFQKVAERFDRIDRRFEGVETSIRETREELLREFNKFSGGWSSKHTSLHEWV